MISLGNVFNSNRDKTTDTNTEKESAQTEQKAFVAATQTQVNESLRHLKEKMGNTSDTGQVAKENVDTTAAPDTKTAKIIPPVAVPCKNYADRPGHFAYIDANTHQAEHVNLVSGKKYSQDEVNALSLRYAVKNMSEAEKNLTWQQVISKDTLYDQFGSPVFSEEEIKRALEHPQNPETPSFVTSSGEDAFGLK